MQTTTETQATASFPRRENTRVPTLAELAAEHYRAAEGDTDAAVQALSDRLLDDPALLRSLVDDMVKIVSTQLISRELTSERGRLIHATQSAGGAARVAALAAGIGRSILDFPLSGGLPLRNATREQILEQAKIYQDQADVSATRARWMKAVGESVPPGKTAGDVLTDAKVEAMLKQATIS